MKNRTLSLAILLSLTAGCASTVQYDDPGKVETINIDFGSTDLQSMAGSMAESLSAAPQLNYYQKSGDDKRIIVYSAGIENQVFESRGINP